MDTFPTDVEVPEPAYNFSHYNEERIVISHGPKNGMLWRGEAFDKEMPLIESLNKVFTQGFTQKDEQSCLANLAYIKEKYPDSICASNTYSNQGEFTGLEQEQLSAGIYGYIYLIDVKNLESIPLCEENLVNPYFIAGSEDTSEGPDYAVISQIDPRRIMGAVPSAFIAFALGMSERNFIINPTYHEIFYFGKVNEASDISLFTTFDALSLKYPNLSIDDVYKKFLEEDAKLATAQSYSEVMTAGNSTFFHRTSSTSALDPHAYSQLKF